LAFPFRSSFCDFKYVYGNNFGTSTGKIPGDIPVDQTEKQSFYSSRVMRYDFFLKSIVDLTKFPNGVDNIYHTLLEDQSSASCTAEGQMDKHVAQAIINMNDTDIVKH